HQREGSSLEIDAATRRNLELVRTLSGERKGSLLSTIDRTLTGAGARLLANHLTAPLTDRAAIEKRLDAAQYLIQQGRLCEDARADLRRCPDMERALGRLSLGRGGPRDLAAIRDGLAGAQNLRQRLAQMDDTPLPDLLTDIADGLTGDSVLADRLNSALVDEPPALVRDGGFIAPGYDADLDQLRRLRDDSRQLIAGLQDKYAKQTGVGGLKIKHNNVIGYHLEVTPTHADKLTTPEQAEIYIHRQTLGSAVRFTTVELTELERAIGEAADKAMASEMALYDSLVTEVSDRAASVAKAASALASLDVAASHATLASSADWNRPHLDDDTAYRVEGGRHPVVEAALATTDQGRFVANDCDLGNKQRLWLLTGPNMAGKSTFLRQNALIVILAQMGSYVPADSAQIGIVDRLFSRVGASDDLARGRSTFMVEMVETAAILNQASGRSLVILDEIGRGTATFDGLSIAWAAVEHLHQTIGCRALFATHYHELTALGAKLEHLSCHTMRVKEWQGDIVFLHEVGPGAADRSYGIHVAKLAGLPAAVVQRAEQVLAALEQGEQGSKLTGLADDLPLFAAPTPIPAAPTAPSPADALLEELNPDEMTPREALEYLYELKRALQEQS
ncbi:MAG: DNA mismatch repair protein MutS, partial [Pseudomonadota bacterium]